MNQPYFKTIFIALFSIFLYPTAVTAQLIPDRTLGSESSRVVPDTNIQNRNNIEGGALRGANLFHSFREFNVNFGQEVYFNNPTGVENIINRVTGSNSSNIFGTLGVNGNANLYLINPNGIVFGNGAKLDINGTFIGTTADGIRLGTNDVYSATNPDSSNLLTIRPEALFINRFKNLQPRKITNQGNLEAINSRTNLTLSADEINNNGSIVAPGGKIFLEATNGDLNVGDINTVDSINGGGDITFSATGNITVNGRIDASGGNVILDNAGFPIDEDLANTITASSGNFKLLAGENITFNSGSSLFAVGTLGGKINIETQGNLKINDSPIASFSTGNIIGNGGDITVKANSIEIVDRINTGSNRFGILTRTLGTANAGNINIDTNSLFTNGADIFTSTFGSGNGGNIDINANYIQLIDRNSSPESRSGIGAQTAQATGNAGNIFINTNSLFIDEAVISTSSLGPGTGGNIDIIARSIELINGGVIIADTGEIGNAGNIFINTDSLFIDGSRISTSSFGNGTGGNININANSIQLINGLGITSETTGTGNTGNISIDTNSLFVDGSRISTSTFGTGAGGNIDINANSIELINGGVIIADTGEIGNAGNIFINTLSLFIDGAGISTSTIGSGAGGTIKIFANNIDLQNGGFINAVSNTSNGGNIEILDNEILTLSNFSIISAEAGIFGGEGNGGNITINSDLIIANPIINGITANAGTGNGGRINITTNAILGYPQFLIIDASSGLGIDGTINLEGLTDELTKGTLFNLPFAIDAEAIFANDICAVKNDKIAGGSSFTIIGKGGITPNPLEYLDRTPSGIVEWSKKPQSQTKITQKVDRTNQKATPTKKILKPAVGWYRRSDGAIVLTDNPDEVRPLNEPVDYSPGCQGKRQDSRRFAISLD